MKIRDIVFICALNHIQRDFQFLCNLQMGWIIIFIVNESYKTHIILDRTEFTGSCGQALNVLQSEAKNRLNVVPRIAEWCLTQFDYNKDIPTNNKSPTVLSWAIGYGRLKVAYMGAIFQIYPKGLPEIGDCARFEAHYSTKDKKKLKDVIPDIIEWDNGNSDDREGGEKKGKKSPFVTAEDMLKKVKEQMKSEDDNGILDD